MNIRNLQNLSRERLINTTKLFRIAGLDPKVMSARMLRRGSSINKQETTALKAGLLALVTQALKIAGLSAEDLINSVLPPFGGEAEAYNRQRKERAVEPIYYLTTSAGNMFSIYRNEDRFLPRTTRQPRSRQNFKSIETIFKYLEKEHHQPTPRQEIEITGRGKDELQEWLAEKAREEAYQKGVAPEPDES